LSKFSEKDVTILYLLQKDVPTLWRQSLPNFLQKDH
jgi:hypothetical protein